MDEKQFHDLKRQMMKIETMVMDVYDEEIKGKKICPVCKNRIRLYLPFGESLRYNAQCPVCRSLERHRALWLYFEKNLGLFQKNGMKLLHFAPEGIFYKRFKDNRNIDYYPVDINSEFPGIRKAVDITCIPYEANSFDMIICNHVLEHIPDEKKALSELFRVLSDEGIAFINTPVSEELEVTLEKSEYNTPELRSRYYGQCDHVRRYGRDYIRHLQSAGFIVEEIKVNENYTEEELTKFGLLRGEKVYCCRKKANQMADEGPLRIKVVNKDGFGDSILDLYLIECIKKLLGNQVTITFVSKYKNFFKRAESINIAEGLETELGDSHYDLTLVDNRIITVRTWKEERVREYSKPLHSYCQNSLEIRQNSVFQNRANAQNINMYSLIQGKKRYEQGDLNNIIHWGTSISKDIPFTFTESDYLVWRKHELDKKQYITINRAVDGKYNANHPKLWPLSNYNELVEQIKQAYPDLWVIQIGSDDQFGRIKGVDLDLLGKTSLAECAVLLNHACLHIGPEGGLIHLNHLVKGTSVVLFGPTCPEIFAYDENINISKRRCAVSCDCAIPGWAQGCILDQEVAVCMRDITVESVFSEVYTHLQKYMN